MLSVLQRIEINLNLLKESETYKEFLKTREEIIEFIKEFDSNLRKRSNGAIEKYIKIAESCNELHSTINLTKSIFINIRLEKDDLKNIPELSEEINLGDNFKINYVHWIIFPATYHNYSNKMSNSAKMVFESMKNHYCFQFDEFMINFDGYYNDFNQFILMGYREEFIKIYKLNVKLNDLAKELHTKFDELEKFSSTSFLTKTYLKNNYPEIYKYIEHVK